MSTVFAASKNSIRRARQRLRQKTEEEVSQFLDRTPEDK